MRFSSSLAAAAAVSLAAAVPLTGSSIQPRSNFPGSQTKTIRYGPFLVDAAATDMAGEDAPLVYHAEKPCANTAGDIPCTILSIQAQVISPEGVVSVVPGGVYAHHIALQMAGPEVKDATCGMSNSSIIYNTGQEFAKVTYIDTMGSDKDGTGADDAKRIGGIYIAPQNDFTINTLLMNPNSTPQNVYISITYDFVPGENPNPDRQTHTVWFNTAQSADGKCTADDNEASRAVSDYPVPNEKTFTSVSSAWVAPWPGKLLSAVGHMHDGGVAIKFYQNGDLVCTSNVEYDDKMIPLDAAGKPSPPFTALKAMDLCDKIDREVKAGDKFHIEGVYDFTKNHGLMEGDGSMSGVMSIGQMFITQTGPAAA